MDGITFRLLVFGLLLLAAALIALVEASRDRPRGA